MPITINDPVGNNFESVYVVVEDQVDNIKAIVTDGSEVVELSIIDKVETIQVFVNDPASSDAVYISKKKDNQLIRVLDGLYVGAHKWQTTKW